MVQRREIDQQSVVKEMIMNAVRINHCKKVHEIIERLQNEDRSLSIEDIHDGIQILEEEKKISLLKPRVRKSFTNYFVKSYGSLPFWANVVIVTLTLVATFFPLQVEPWSILRIIVGGIFILFIPGFTLIQLLFPTKEINYIERIILSICISLGMIPLVGLVLYTISAGVNVYIVTLSISLLVLPISLAAQYRKFSQINRAYPEIIEATP